MTNRYKIFLFILGMIFLFDLGCQKTQSQALLVLANLPQGKEVPLTTEGITVLFDQPMVPLTTLDQGRDTQIPLNIEPKTPGKFFWLGTRGFIFRPKAPFLPATTYTVSLPTTIESTHGQRLENKIAWQFTTVRPKVIGLWPHEPALILPHEAVFSIQFNLAMDQKDVAKKLLILDADTNKPLAVAKEFVWFEEDHRVLVKLKGSLGSAQNIVLQLPKGLRAGHGDLGLNEDYKNTFTTLPTEFSLEGIFLGSDYQKTNPLDLARENHIRAGEALCFEFSQPIVPESFETALTVSKKNDGQKITMTRPDLYFYHKGMSSFPNPNEENPYEEKTGYDTVCVSGLNEFDQHYDFEFNNQKILALSQARFLARQQTLAVKTNHAPAQVELLLTQQILHPNISTQIPYKVRNIKKATARLYRLQDKDHYSESLKNVEPCTSRNLISGNNFSVPVDCTTGTIDQARLAADWTQEIDFASLKSDEEKTGSLDLATFNQGKGLEPGLYLIEMFGFDRFDDQKIASPRLTAFQITEVSLALKRELDHALVWATDIESGKPVPGLSVQVFLKKYDYQKKGLVTLTKDQGTTSEHGVALFKGNFSGTDILKGDTYGSFLCAEVMSRPSLACENDHKISSYREPLTPGPHYDAFIHTDRPLYRPGQTVYFSAFVREVSEGRYFTPERGARFQVKVEDAAYNSIFETESNLESGGILKGKLTLDAAKDTPRGPYRIVLSLAGTKNRQIFEKTFTVASYKKPSFKIDVKTAQPEVVSLEPVEVQVLGSYFFGAPLRKTKGTWSIMTSTYDFSPEGYEDFIFFDTDLVYAQAGSNRYDNEYGYASDYEYDVISEGLYKEDDNRDLWRENASETRAAEAFFKDKDGFEVNLVQEKTNDEGLFNIVTTPDLKKYPTSQVLEIEADIEDPSHQQVSGSLNVVVHKAKFYLGVAPQKWVYGENEMAAFDVVSLDTRGKILPNQDFSATVVRREYQYSERQNAQGYWEWIDEKKDTVLKTLNQTTDANGKSTIEFQIPEGGEYRVIVSGKDDLENAIQSGSSVFAWGKGYVPWKINKTQGIELVPDKENYQVGETAKILIKSLMPLTKALLTFERGRILEHKVVDLGGNASHIEIPIVEGMIPNFYVSVVAHTKDPLLYYGETEVTVAAQTKKLSLKLTPDREPQVIAGQEEPLPLYRPGDKVKIKVKTTNHLGKPTKSHVIIAVADESVLRLLNFRLPDLIKYFYYKRPNSVITSSSLRSLKSGDGGNSSLLRKNFRDTAFFEGNLTTDVSGEAEFEFTLPDDLTTWVIDGLAISESKTRQDFESVDSHLASSDGTWVGSARARVVTTLPILVRAGLPRFVAWEDRVEAKIILNNRLNEPVTGAVTVEISDAAQFDNQGQTLELPFDLPALTEQVLPLPFQVTKNLGTLKLKAQALDHNKKFLDGFENTIPIEDRSTPELVATSGMTTDKAQEQIDLPPNLRKDTGALTVSTKASLGLALARPLTTLFYYPYGCAEQKSARLISMLIARDLLSLYGDTYLTILSDHQKTIFSKNQSQAQRLQILDNVINQSLIDLFDNHQNEDGGFRYWPQSKKSDFYASGQILWALSLAQKTQVFTIDSEAVNRLKKFIMDQIQTADLSLDAVAYGLWGLALAGNQQSYLAEPVIKRHTELSVSGLSYLLAALAHTEENKTSLALIENRLKTLAQHESRHVQWPASSFFWSASEKNTALATYSLLTHNAQDPFIQKGLAFLINRKKLNPFVETQNNLYKTWLGYQIAKIQKEEKTNFTATVTLAQQELVKTNFDAKNLLREEKKQILIAEITKMPADLILQKTGEGMLYYDLEFLYYLPTHDTPVREEGLVIAREYYALDDLKEEHPLTEFKAGETYKGVLTLLTPKDRHYILIEELLPAGFEPIDATLATSSHAAYLMAKQNPDDDSNEFERDNPYDDVFTISDYGMDFGFAHQEIRDDAILWSDSFVPAGQYTIRYPVRATTEGTFTASGARAFEFYEPEIFGRSRSRHLVIKKRQ